jgi:hypothetical protein
MRNKIYLCIAVTLIIFSCDNSPRHYAVLDYEDFGPQAMAWKKIGMQWWQWDKRDFIKNIIGELPNNGLRNIQIQTS